MTTAINYLIELRSRFIRCLVVTTIVFIILCFFSNTLYDWLAIPLLKHLPANQKLLATAITSPFLAPLKLAFATALFITAPFWLYQLWCYIAPALYHHEQKRLWLLLIGSTVLFYIGVAFAYFVLFPWMFRFFIHTAPASVEVRPDISQFLDFVLKLLLVFGAAFEVPIIILTLIWTGITTTQQLKQKRPYVIVGAFIIGMLLTPPDVISQTMLAIPLWILFELGLWLGRWIEKKK